MKTKSLPTLLHIIIIWCLSIQESVQLDYDNNFERGLPGIPLNSSIPISSSRQLQLYSRASAKHIRIMGREVDANGSVWDMDARLIIRTDSQYGQITIQGEQSGYYLCINKKGHVVGRKRIKMSPGVTCGFRETINNGYTELRLVQRTETYLGFNKDGRAMSAHRTRQGGVKSVQFLKRPLPEDSATADESSMSTADFYRLYQLIQQVESNEGPAREDTDS